MNALYVMFKKSLPNPRSQDFLIYYLPENYSFTFYIYVIVNFRLIFMFGMKYGIKFYSFALRCPVNSVVENIYSFFIEFAL